MQSFFFYFIYFLLRENIGCHYMSFFFLVWLLLYIHIKNVCILLFKCQFPTIAIAFRQFDNWLFTGLLIILIKLCPQMCQYKWCFSHNSLFTDKHVFDQNFFMFCIQVSLQDNGMKIFNFLEYMNWQQLYGTFMN